MSAVNVIEVRNLRKNYGPLAAVDGVDLSIAPGEIFALWDRMGRAKLLPLRFLKASAHGIRDT
jgi:ABC-type sugar transport system ATPase subunit